jgi:hypothetical protein
MELVKTVEQVGGLAKVRAGAKVSITVDHTGVMVVRVVGHEPILFNPGLASLVNRKVAELKGWKARLEDAAAVSADVATGKTDTAEKYRAIKELVDFYELGGEEWTRKVAKVVKQTGPDVGLLIRAMVRLGKARDVDHANRRVDGLVVRQGCTREEALALLWGAGDIAKEVAVIRAEDAPKPKVNADDLLGEMEEGDEELN